MKVRAPSVAIARTKTARTHTTGTRRSADAAAATAQAINPMEGAYRNRSAIRDPIGTARFEVGEIARKKNPIANATGGLRRHSSTPAAAAPSNTTSESHALQSPHEDNGISLY